MMNFSRYNIVKMQKEARSLPAKIRSLVFVFLLRVFVVILAMCVIIGSYSAFGGYLGIISKSPDIEGVFESNKDFEKYSTFLFYSNGEKMEKELSSAGANRIKADIRTIPEGVRSIGSGAFRSCAALADAVLPDSVTSIGRECITGEHHIRENTKAEASLNKPMNIAK